MIKYIALLRGINVGGKNKIAMPELKSAFQKEGFENVIAYINSGNVIFESELNAAQIKIACEKMIADHFGLSIVVAIITAEELIGAIIHAPEWWNADKQSVNNAIFIIPPTTAKEVCESAGAIKPEYEKVSDYGKVIFWTAPLSTYSRTRLSKVVENKAIYNQITIRNANTTLKLAELVK